MTRWLSTLALVILLAAPAAAEAPSAADPINEIMKRAQAAEGNRPALEKALAEIDAEVTRDGSRATAHYARGRILSALGRGEDAVASYDTAVKLDKKFAEAHYNAGVVLAGLGKKKEAIKRWDLALKIDPKMTDAAYNGGQASYDLKDFKGALKRFGLAAKLSPDDFDATKKVMQAQLALKQDKPAWKTRAALFAMWKDGKAPGGATATEYVLDQFDVGPRHVLAYETFDPSGDLANVYTFKVLDAAAKKVDFTVQLETSAVIREQGTPWVMGTTTHKGHSTVPPFFKKLPTYTAVRKSAIKMIDAELRNM
ncbi:MAG: tetratricopeptide repeat protein [Deltaproteobacteria bacterium]|nr:tetratricopeptide repeat protein [Deltaproteobacteria bacterium]